MAVALGNSVDVVIAVRNAATTVSDTLRSLAPDRHTIGKVILIDDGSTDETVVRAETAATDAALPLEVHRQPGFGVGAARNRGIAATSGHVYCIDGDDLLLPGSLATLAQVLASRPDIGAVYGPAVIRRPGRADTLSHPSRLSQDRATNSRDLLRDRIAGVLTGSYLLRGSVAKANPFPETMVYDEDICFWASIFASTDVATVEKPILVYNASADRAHRRLTTDARARFLSACRVLRALQSRGLDREALQWRKARLALRVGSKLVKDGRHDEALPFLRLAWRHPDLRGLHTSRYLLQARLGRTRNTPQPEARKFVAT